VAGSWGALVAELTPLALVVALSPLSVIPAVVLVLQSARPRATGLTYLAGWLIGLLTLTVLFVQLPRLLGDMHAPSAGWTSWARMVIGAVLIIAGAWRWATRHRSTGTPAWLNRISDLTPGRAGAIGFVLILINPKFVVVCAAAGVAISTAKLGTVGTGVVVVYYTVLAGSTAIVPVLAHALAADRLDTWLQRGRQWIERHTAAITAIILVAIGITLLYSGIHALLG
jgi:hypothetical protein